MSTFYVLPSRHQVGRQFAEVLSGLFPGLTWPASAWPDLAETLGSTALSHLDVYVVFREDLLDGIATEESLATACGAEAGDEIVEISPGAQLTQITARRWRLESAGKAAA